MCRMQPDGVRKCSTLNVGLQSLDDDWPRECRPPRGDAGFRTKPEGEVDVDNGADSDETRTDGPWHIVQLGSSEEGDAWRSGRRTSASWMYRLILSSRVEGRQGNVWYAEKEKRSAGGR
jgi:hypothetical protein